VLIGGAAVAVGGGGSTCGIACAVMALVSIFAGKMMAIQFGMPDEIRKLAEPHLTKELFEEDKKDAAGFAKVESKDYAEFMVAHGFTKAKNADKVTAGELADFEKDRAPRLRWVEGEKPSYAEWRKHELTELTHLVAARVPVSELVAKNLGAIDVLFGLLGIATAYRIPARRGL